MINNVPGSVVVITGASSGIGRATALEFARNGAKVVVAARRRQPLEELAAECRALSGTALAVTCDVTDETAVRALAATAIDRLGQLDAWVNSAGVAMWSRFDDAPADLFRRVFETNLFGVVHGARAALPHFRARNCGVLVNVASMVGKMAMPCQTAYSAAKFAVVGFSESLRQELQNTGIDVVTVMPGAVDTPLFDHGANYLGLAIKPPQAVADAEDVAKVIVAAVKRPQRECYVGAVPRALSMLHALAPTLYDRAAVATFETEHLTDSPCEPTAGNLVRPMAEGTETSGGWLDRPAAALGQRAKSYQRAA